MAYSKPLNQGQVTLHCQLCEGDPKIKWKCLDCNLFLCTKCKEKIHSKVVTAVEHQIIDIKEIWAQDSKESKKDQRMPASEESKKDQRTPASEECKKNPRMPASQGPEDLKTTTSQQSRKEIDFGLSSIQEYSTNLSAVMFIAVSFDDSLWIANCEAKKRSFFSLKSSKSLQKVKLMGNRLKLVSSFNLNIDGIAITSDNDVLLSTGQSTLKQINNQSNKIEDSKYCVNPFGAISIHVTRDKQVVVGACNDDNKTAAVFVMDINGIHQTVYQYYKQDVNNKNIFTFPLRITSTIAGTICVIDLLTDMLKGRVVMLGHGDVVATYEGHPNINNENNPFSPIDFVTTQLDNIIMVENYNHTLHILNNAGSLMTYINTKKIGILCPLSVAFSMARQFSILYIGCGNLDGSSENEKFYKTKLSGF